MGGLPAGRTGRVATTTSYTSPLLNDVAASFVQPRVNVIKFIFVLNLNTKVIESGLSATCRYGEVYARIIKHPLGII